MAQKWSPVALFVLEDDRVVDCSCSETFEVGFGEATVIGGGCIVVLIAGTSCEMVPGTFLEA
jgi:hypothetical protein